MFGFFKKQSKGSLSNKIEDAVDVSSHAEHHDLAELRRRLENRVAELGVQIARKDAEINKLKDELGDAKRQLEFRVSGIDRYQAEIQAAFKETEVARHTITQLKEEVTKYRQENEDLKEKITKLEAATEESSDESESDEDSSGSRSSKRAALEARVTELEQQVSELEREKGTLLAARENLEADRHEELKIIQDALETALKEKDNAKVRFEKEYESLRTVNNSREAQMLEDFEWKLRQVEQSAKKKVEDKSKESDKRVIELRTELEREKAAHIKDLDRVRRVENEARELRELSHEQQRLLRVASREHEAVQTSERLLKDEISRLNAQLDKEKNILAAIQSMNQKKMEDRERIYECRLEKQRQEISKEVEEKSRKELASKHAEELNERLQKLREQHEKELAAATKQAQTKIDAAHRQVSALRQQISRKEDEHTNAMKAAQTESDQEVMDLRRRIDKLDYNYQDRMDILIEKHEAELEDVERRAVQAEQQAGQLRATLELVKEQFARDTEEKIANLQHHHRQQLARQHEELNEIHAENLATVRAQHQAELAALVKGKTNGEVEVVDQKLAETLNKLRRQELIIADLSSTIREQDHALTTLTQEKRALQLQLRQNESSSPTPTGREDAPSPVSPVRGLQRISECTEPSRDSSRDTSLGQSLSSNEDYYPHIEEELRPLSNGKNMCLSPESNGMHFSTPCREFVPTSRSQSPILNEKPIICDSEGSATSEKMKDISRSPSPCTGVPQILNICTASPRNSPDLKINYSGCSSPDLIRDQSRSPSPYEIRCSSPEEYNSSYNHSSRRSSQSDEFAECQEVQQFTIRLPCSPNSLSPNAVSSTNHSSPSPNSSLNCTPPELHVPRAYYLSHSPDPVFPRTAEIKVQARSKSLGSTPFPIKHRTFRASSCPSIPCTSSDEEVLSE